MADAPQQTTTPHCPGCKATPLMVNCIIEPVDESFTAVRSTNWCQGCGYVFSVVTFPLAPPQPPPSPFGPKDGPRLVGPGGAPARH
jgi:hypothetical protein